MCLVLFGVHLPYALFWCGFWQAFQSLTCFWGYQGISIVFTSTVFLLSIQPVAGVLRFGFFFVCTLCGFEHPACLVFSGKHLLCALFFGKVARVNSVLLLACFLVPKALLWCGLLAGLVFFVSSIS